jgi:hypothetical protein
MNIFSEVNDILGGGMEHPMPSLQLFLELAQDIRIKLGKQGYLLNKYLSYLFEVVNQTLVHVAASDGFEAASQLNSMCSGIVLGNPKYTDHPFYEQVRKHIQTHPLDFQEPYTKITFYSSELHDRFMKTASERYFTERKEESISVIDICDLHELYANICGLLGSDEPLDRLNLLFRQRFLMVSVMTAFLQGITNQLVYSLSYRDRETSKQVFQLLLDMEGECQ